MRDDPGTEWVDIVVPCYGYCIVARASIQRIEPETNVETSFSAGYSRLITTLNISTEESFRTLFPLILFVGSKLLSLDINPLITNDELRSILSSCPNLVNLHLMNTTHPTGWNSPRRTNAGCARSRPWLSTRCHDVRRRDWRAFDKLLSRTSRLNIHRY